MALATMENRHVTFASLAGAVALSAVTVISGQSVDAAGTRSVSKDGKTMTITAKGTTAKGEPVDDLLVFEKR